MNESSYPFELLEIEGAYNVRDLGGYLGADHRPVKKRRLIRAGGMHALTKKGILAVRSLGVDCIVDLRSRMEVQQKPDSLCEDARIAYVHIPMLDYIQSKLTGGMPDYITSFPASLEEMYIGLLEHSRGDFLRVFEVFANPAYHTILFHCTAGKDRTGLTAMLALGLAGVSHADLVRDYSYSDQLAPPLPKGVVVPPHLLFSPASVAESVLAHLEQNYGGMSLYFSQMGLSDLLRSSILNKILD